MMRSPSITSQFLALLLAWTSARRAAATLNIEIDEIQCDESLPAFTTNGSVAMTCHHGKSTKCMFGEEVVFGGTLEYRDLSHHTYNGTGYASINLNIFSMEYSLIQSFPIDFCGDWIAPANSSGDGQACPFLDGFYEFSVPYTLLWEDDDIVAWFAKGWQGESSLEIRLDDSPRSPMLADCKVYWHASRPEGTEWTAFAAWNRNASIPLGVETMLALALLFIAAFTLWCCCCRRRSKKATGDGVVMKR